MGVGLFPLVLYIVIFGGALLAWAVGGGQLGMAVMGGTLLAWAGLQVVIQPGLWAVATGHFSGRRRLWGVGAAITAVWALHLTAMALVAGSAVVAAALAGVLVPLTVAQVGLAVTRPRGIAASERPLLTAR